MKQELAPRGVGIPVLQGREDVKTAVIYSGPWASSAALESVAADVAISLPDQGVTPEMLRAAQSDFGARA